MRMRTNPTRLFLAVMAMGLPAISMAQAGYVVPPPSPPSATAPAAATQSVPAVAQAVPAAKKAPAVLQPGVSQGVMPPDAVSSANAGAAAANKGAAPLIDIALPQAPKPDAATGTLKPGAPVANHVATSAAHAKKKKAVKATPKAKAPNPFAGVQGTPVSDSQLNRFVYPEPLEGVYFQEGAPLPECPKDAGAQDPCKPTFLNGKRVMLLQLRAGAKGPVQMISHLHSGRIVTMNLEPHPGPGAVVRVDGAEDGASDARLADAKFGDTTKDTSMTSSEQDVDLLSHFARGDIPGGFEPEAVSGPVRYEFFDVTPLAAWSDGVTWRVHLMQVKAFGHNPVAINSGLFRSEHVRAVALDRETITDQAPAQLYLLERLTTEQQ